MADDFLFDVGLSSHSNSELYVTDFTPPALRDDNFAEPNGGEELSMLETMSNNASRTADNLMAVFETGSMMADSLYTGLLGDYAGGGVNKFRHGTVDAVSKGIEGSAQLGVSAARTYYDLNLGSVAAGIGSLITSDTNESSEFAVGRDVEKSDFLPDPVRGLESLIVGADTASMIVAHPIEMLIDPSIDPIKESWNKGEYAYAVGLGLGEVIVNAVGPKGTGKLGTVKTTAAVAETASKVAANTAVKEFSPLGNAVYKLVDEKLVAIEAAEAAAAAAAKAGKVYAYTADMIPGIKPKPGHLSFEEFMDKLKPSEFTEALSNPKVAEKVDRLLRNGGGMHEGIPVSMYRKYRNQFDLKVNDVWNSATPINEMKFINPGEHKSGMHGGEFSTTYHEGIYKVFEYKYNSGDKKQLFDVLKEYDRRWSILNTW